MKHKVELDSLFSAIRYCATADNSNDFWERWDRLKVTEQLEVLANVTFFDDWQTNEQREFSLYRAEKANAECREIDELLAPFWDNTPETTESRYLVGQWAGIQMHILGEMHELREYIRATKEPEKTQGQKEIEFLHRAFAQNEQIRNTQQIEFLHRVFARNEQKRNTQQMTSSPATEPEQKPEPEQSSMSADDELMQKIKNDEILLPCFFESIHYDYDDRPYKETKEDALYKVIKEGLNCQKNKGVERKWKDGIKKAIEGCRCDLTILQYKQLQKGFAYYGIEIDEHTARRWRTIKTNF